MSLAKKKRLSIVRLPNYRNVRLTGTIEIVTRRGQIRVDQGFFNK